MAIRALTLAAALTLVAGAATVAAQEDDQQNSPGEMAREGVEQLMNAIETFVHSLPMYGAPRIDDEGNIIIPRIDNDEAPQRKPERKPERRDRSPGGEGDVTEI
ncbi:hypothetical protein [Rhodovibrio salinarum]|uniref:Uncharacterized protein n=1 Tax=Rhodovibrio salinarum TaxID=1087 RepID=A0A934QIM9_9PROT|nr:hypothetical protein [Rhodovibrio salinarum]MBK1697412.1 hypothetical protein [Rhodovibrio salinarum]